MTRLLRFAALAALFVLSSCVSVDVANVSAAYTHYRLDDAAGGIPRRAKPLVNALLVQSSPADALADTVSISYSRRANEFAFYQFASWTERPVRRLPRLLQRRLEARGVAAAVGLIGEPLRSDWLITIAIDTMHHDASTLPGVARFALTAELFDRRNRARKAHKQFDANVPVARADSAAAAVALSQAVTQVFDALVPWLEDELQHAGTAVMLFDPTAHRRAIAGLDASSGLYTRNP